MVSKRPLSDRKRRFLKRQSASTHSLAAFANLGQADEPPPAFDALLRCIRQVLSAMLGEVFLVSNVPNLVSSERWCYPHVWILRSV